MMEENQKELDGLIQEVMDQMGERGYAKKTATHYRGSFQLLTSISHDIGDDRLSERLIKAFLDKPARCNEKWAPKELAHRKRCIRLLLSLARKGTVDWRRQDTDDISGKLINKAFRVEMECFVRYLEQEGFSPNTISGYKRIVAYFLLFCQKSGYGKLSDIQTNDVSTFILSLYKDGRYQPSTVGSGLAGLRRFLSANGHTAQFLLEIPVHLPREPYFFTEEEILAFFRECDMAMEDSHLEGRHLVLPAIFRLLYCCGLRCKEARTLARENVHLDGGYLDILQSKGPKSRRVHISGELAEYLAVYDRRVSRLFPERVTFFPNKEDHPYSASWLEQNFLRFWYAAFPGKRGSGISIRAYDFRHHFVYANMNRWLKEGKDVNAMLPYLMRYMGHSDVKNTLYYFHPVPDIYGGILDRSRHSERLVPEVADGREE